MLRISSPLLMLASEHTVSVVPSILRRCCSKKGVDLITSIRSSPQLRISHHAESCSSEECFYVLSVIVCYWINNKVSPEMPISRC